MHQSQWKLTKRYSPLKKLRQSLILFSLKLIPKLNFSFCYRHGRKIRLQGLQEILCVCLFFLYDCLIFKLINRSCVIVERNHVFNLLGAGENELSMFRCTCCQIHQYNCITSLISFLSEVGNSLILSTKDINLQ